MVSQDFFVHASEEGSPVFEKQLTAPGMQTEEVPLVSLEGVAHSFRQRQGLFVADTAFYALRSVTLALYPGETFGLIGESGCGKSTLARVVTGLIQPSEGIVRVKGKLLHAAKEHKDYKAFRQDVCRTIQMVFQDSQASLNPRMRVCDSVAEALVSLESAMPKAERQARVEELLTCVGISAEQASRYPHEFSGGQRQRIAIARALAIYPGLVVCDEPTSSLDSSVQAQVLNVLMDMQQRFGLAYLFISHDLVTVRYVSDFAAVMYGGVIIEQGPTEVLFSRPRHPYSQLLLHSSMPLGEIGSGTAAPSAKTRQREKKLATGYRPGDSSGLGGCPFAGRCPLVVPQCRQVFPAFVTTAESADTRHAHLVRCPVVFT